MPGYAKRQNTNRSGKSRPKVVPSNREYYSGANQTRNSVANNPSAYVSYKDPLYGVPTFGRKAFNPGQDFLDAAADKEINKGYTTRKNPLCQKCYIQMPTAWKYAICRECA